MTSLDPTDEVVAFRTIISFIDAKPQISWTPRLMAEEEAKRTYTVEGRESMAEGSWGPTNAASRFFKVKVEMR